jgi:hypothetical protein
MPSTEDTLVVHIDRPTIMMVDAFRDRSMFRPSRRQAVRALIRQALRAHEIKAAKVMSAPTTEQQPGGAA